MKIEDFADMKQFECIMKSWALATGLATVAVGSDGEYISDCYNFTDFCIKLTRGSKKGCARCEKCDKTGHGVYNCHAGLVDFAIPLEVNGEKVGSVIGGQVLPENPDEEKFRKVAREIGVDEEEYIAALHKVNVRTRECIEASANLLGAVLNNFLQAEYAKMKNSQALEQIKDGVNEVHNFVEQAVYQTGQLQDIQNQQRILALNASIEAARAGTFGAGFNVVAEEVGKLSTESAEVNKEIKSVIGEIEKAVEKLTKVF